MKDRNEAVRELSKVTGISVAYAEDLYDSFFPKPVIPWYIADYLEKVKSEGNLTVVGAVNEAPEGRVGDWLILEKVHTFVQAWFNGYEVEKEKQYTVKIKAVLGQYLGKYYLNDEELTPQFTSTQFTGDKGRPTFTRKELEDADFGWVFDCQGVEVKEVDDGND
jgi:hypothetical protein|nr:MAG TPA: Protein of unknown function (DUF1642) [Caudoviricetes sp.]